MKTQQSIQYRFLFRITIALLFSVSSTLSSNIFENDKSTIINTYQRKVDKIPSIHPKMEPLVVSGFSTPPDRFPWYTTLYVQTDRGLFLCGGVLIDPHWVLSAAHCIRPGTMNVVMLIGQYFTNYTFQNETMPNSIDKKRPANILMHPRWDFETFEYDFMLLRLEEPSDLPVVAIDNGTIGELVYPGDPLAVMGLGTLSNTGGADLPVVLQQADVKYVSNEVCAEAWADYINITDVMACNIGDGNTCYGDSGGPLIVERNEIFPEDVLFGIVSFGKGQQCVSPTPNVAGRVSAAYPWILDVIATWEIIMAEQRAEANTSSAPSQLSENESSVALAAPASVTESVSAEMKSRTTDSPTNSPTFSPTNAPTINPTYSPTFRPTNNPTSNPTNKPTNNPTNKPTNNPTNNPTIPPTNLPTSKLTPMPTYNKLDLVTREKYVSMTPAPVITWSKPNQVSITVKHITATVSKSNTVSITATKKVTTTTTTTTTTSSINNNDNDIFITTSSQEAKSKGKKNKRNKVRNKKKGGKKETLKITYNENIFSDAGYGNNKVLSPAAEVFFPLMNDNDR